MKRILSFILAGALALSAVSLSACSPQSEESASPSIPPQEAETVENTEFVFDGTTISLSDDEIFVNGESASDDETAAVYVANDIVFYLEGQDFTYGEGSVEDEHSQEEADKHRVIHITQPGDYALEGRISAAQVAIDLGEDAEEDPNAVVNLYLNGVDISCSVAPGIIFYNVYECCSSDEENATKDVDTSAAGANVFLVDGTENTVNGSYVARIYKSVELSEDGKTVVDSKKLHKYDGAFYSKQSMNINGDTGILNINAENEGLDSELHLTINGGIINIDAGNDGINTNEDYVSVTTVNGGELNITVNGSTGEGDGIDSNGWLVINGGNVVSSACGFSGDAGIDADLGVHVNGGTVIASGNMYDRLEEGGQNYAVFHFASKQSGGQCYSFRDTDGEELFSVTPDNDFMYLILSSPSLKEGTYSLWCGETQLAHSGTEGMMGGFGAMHPEMNKDDAPQPPEGMEGMMKPEDFTINEDGSVTLPDGTNMSKEEMEAQMAEHDFGAMHPEMNKGDAPQPPKGMEGMMKPEDFTINEDGSVTLPDGTTMSKEEMEAQMANHGFGHKDNKGSMSQGNQTELSTEFSIVTGVSFFNAVSLPAESN